jgi:hypothetical protein
MAATTKQPTNHRDTSVAIGDVKTPILAGGSGFRLKKDERWVNLSPPYDGARMRMWVNFPLGKYFDLRSSDPTISMPAFREIVLEHDGWEDFDGNALPPVTDEEFVPKLPQGLLNAILDKVREAHEGKLDFPSGTSSNS